MAAPPHRYRFPQARTCGFQSSGQAVSPHRYIQYLLKRRFDYSITCSELLDQLTRVQECLVIMDINGEKVDPKTVLSELNGKDRETWSKVELLLEDLKQHPAVGL